MSNVNKLKDKLSSAKKRYGFQSFNKPKRTPGKNKKFAVLAKKGDKIKLVRFGDPDMKIKSHIKERKSSYCGRSAGIKGTKDLFSANYWSRKAWKC